MNDAPSVWDLGNSSADETPEDDEAFEDYNNSRMESGSDDDDATDALHEWAEEADDYMVIW